jgi:hypothetical protein
VRACFFEAGQWGKIKIMKGAHFLFGFLLFVLVPGVVAATENGSTRQQPTSDLEGS